MRFLTIVCDLNLGGTQRAAQNFSNAFALKGHEVWVFAQNAGGPRVSELQKNNIKVLVGDGEKGFQTKKLLNEIVIWTPEVIHIHSHAVSEQIIKQLLLQFQVKPFVVETNVFSKPTPWLDVVDISFQLSTWCLWLYRLRLPKTSDTSRVDIIPNAVNAENFLRVSSQKITEFKDQYRIPQDVMVFGRLGQPYDGKWSYLLFDCFERYLNTYSSNAYLIVVGVSSIYREYIEGLNNRVQEKIIVIDRISGDDALSVFYSSLDVFLHIADQGESFGMVLAETQLCQTPVITLSTPWGDNSQCEVVKNQLGGLVVSTKKGFVNAMIELASNKTMRQLMGVNGRKRIQEKFDISIVSTQVLSKIDEQLKKAKGISDKNQFNDKHRDVSDCIIEIYKDTADSYSSLVVFLLASRFRLAWVIKRGWVRLIRLVSNFHIKRV